MIASFQLMACQPFQNLDSVRFHTKAKSNWNVATRHNRGDSPTYVQVGVRTGTVRFDVPAYCFSLSRK